MTSNDFEPENSKTRYLTQLVMTKLTMILKIYKNSHLRFIKINNDKTRYIKFHTSCYLKIFLFTKQRLYTYLRLKSLVYPPSKYISSLEEVTCFQRFVQAYWALCMYMSGVEIYWSRHWSQNKVIDFVIKLKMNKTKLVINYFWQKSCWNFLPFPIIYFF